MCAVKARRRRRLALGMLLVLLLLPTWLGAGQALAATDGYDAEEQYMLQIINNYRQANSCTTVSHDSTVQTGAESWAKTSPAPAQHSSPPNNYGEILTFVTDLSPYGHDAADEALNWWKNSQPHNAKILTCSYSTVGIGHEWRSGGNFGTGGAWYWVARFGGSGGSYGGTEAGITPPVLDSNIAVTPGSLWSGSSVNFTFTLKNTGTSNFDVEEVYIEGTSPTNGNWKMNAQPQIILAGQGRQFVASMALPTNDPGWWQVTKLIQIHRRGGAWYTVNQGGFAFPAEIYVNPYDSTPPSVVLTAPGDNYFYTYEILATANASDSESGVKKVEFHFKLNGQWQVMWVDDTPADGFSYHFPGNSYGPQSDLWILAWAENNSGVRQQSGAVMHITNIDTQAPQVSISGPTPGQSFSGDYIDVQATASDNVGVDHVTFYLGYPGGLISMTDANGSDGWSARLSIRDLPNMNGMYVNAHAYDAKNNDGASGAISNLSISRPCPCFENVKSGQGYDNIVQVALRTPSPANWVNLYLTPQGQGYRGRSMVLWGDLVWRTSWDVSDLPEGTRMMMDGWIGYPSGQQQTQVFTDLVIDRSNPSMHLTGLGDGATFNNTVTVTASASDQYSGVDKVVFYFAWSGNSLPEITDTDGSNGWQATFDTSALGPGSYRLDAWVYDKVGHASHSPEVWWITKN